MQFEREIARVAVLKRSGKRRWCRASRRLSARSRHSVSRRARGDLMDYVIDDRARAVISGDSQSPREIRLNGEIRFGIYCETAINLVMHPETGRDKPR